MSGIKYTNCQVLIKQMKKDVKNISILQERVKGLEIETDRREKIFMEVVNKKSEQAEELQAVNEYLKKANSRIKKLEETRKKHNEEIIRFCNTMERMIDKIIKKERF